MARTISLSKVTAAMQKDGKKQESAATPAAPSALQRTISLDAVTSAAKNSLGNPAPTVNKTESGTALKLQAEGREDAADLKRVEPLAEKYGLEPEYVLQKEKEREAKEPVAIPEPSVESLRSDADTLSAEHDRLVELRRIASNEAEGLRAGGADTTEADARVSELDKQIESVRGASKRTAEALSDKPTRADELRRGVGYIAERTVGGAADTAQNIINYIGMLGQGTARSTMQSDEFLNAALPLQEKTGYDLTGAAQRLTSGEFAPVADFSTKYRQDVEERYEDVGKTARVIGDAAAGVGGMVPAVLAKFIAPGSSLYVMAASAAGGAATEAKNEGASDEKAMLYGTSVGILEAASEKLFDGVAQIFGKGKADELVERVVRSAVKNETAQNAVLAIAGVLGEGAEEFATELGDRVLNEALVDTDDRSFLETLGDGAYSFLIGSLVSGMVQAANVGITNAKQAAGVVVDKVKSDIKAARPETTEETLLRVGDELNAPQEQGAPVDGETLLLEAAGIKKAASDEAGEQTLTKKIGNAIPYEETPLSTSDRRASQTGAYDTVVNNEEFLGATITPPDPVVNPDDGLGAMTPQFPYAESVNQQNSTQSAFNDAERAMVGLREEDATHRVVTDAEAIEKARLRLESDFDFEAEDLPTKSGWDKEDTTLAHLILRKYVEDARETGDYTKVKEWNKVLTAHTSAQGQALQANAQFARTPERVISDAADALEESEALPDVQNELLRNIGDLAYSYDNAMSSGNLNELAEIIRATSRIRRTGSLMRNRWSRQMNWAINRVIAERDINFLSDLAFNGIQAIITDQFDASGAEKLLTIRRNAMLTKASTVFRNLVSNNIFDPIDSLARNISVPLDMLLSKFTGTRSVSVDKSWLSAAKRRGTLDGLARSMLEVGLDVEATGATGRYESGSSRTFKMTGGVVERLLSSWEKWMGYALNVTDEMQKEGVRAEVQRGLDQLYERGSITDDTLREGGETEALYRTFQDDTALSNATLGLRSALNHINYMGVGLGDVTVPFAKVPANVTARAIEYSPVGLATTAIDLAQTLQTAVDGRLTAQDQARIVQRVGRSLTGSALIAIATIAAIRGVIKAQDTGGEEEDKDKSAVDKMTGLTGTQINLSALKRLFTGESTEWRDGDTLMSIGFLEPLNAQLTTGVLLAEDYKAGDIGVDDVLLDSVSGAVTSLLDLPMMDPARDVINAYQYSDEETAAGRLLDAAGQFVAGEVNSLVPNALRGVAQGTDRMQRDAYTSDSFLGQVFDNFKASVPGLRQTLPAKVDPYGREVASEGRVLNFLNSNILPGAITTYREDAVTALQNDIYEETGDARVYPDRKAPNKVGEHELTNDEKRAYQKTYGDTYTELSQMAVDASDTLYNEDLADVLALFDAYSGGVAKQELLSGKGESYALTGDARTVERALETSDPVEYLVLRQSLSKELNSETPDYAQLEARLNSLNTQPDDVANMLLDTVDGLDKISAFVDSGMTAQEADLLYDDLRALEPLEGYSQVTDQQRRELIINRSGISDKEKAGAVKQYLSENQAKKLDAVLNSGASLKDWLTAKQEFDRIDKDTKLSTNEKATKFAQWVDNHYKGGEASALKAAHTYSSGFTAAPDTYAKFTAAGLEPDDAAGLFDALGALEPVGDNKSVSSLQKYEVITNYPGLSDREILDALDEYMPDTSEKLYQRYVSAYEAGMSPADFTEYYGKVTSFEADKNSKGESIKDSKKKKTLEYIDSLPLTDEQKDILYLIEYKETTLKDTPWH